MKIIENQSTSRNTENEKQRKTIAIHEKTNKQGKP